MKSTIIFALWYFDCSSTSKR
ncbi:hypothetical protein Gotri_006712 [Gossypium trilobum]|uniref:Uncharacterized protein n=1 Tax=Gossypium trilobum TaxID=34281 RepID=A0A7J9FS16_9ROSI|nr:hypothetical protein [Gossypium trilobum]